MILALETCQYGSGKDARWSQGSVVPRGVPVEHREGAEGGFTKALHVRHDEPAVRILVGDVIHAPSKSEACYVGFQITLSLQVWLCLHYAADCHFKIPKSTN